MSSERRRARVIPPHPAVAAIRMLLLVGVLYVIEAVNSATAGGLNRFALQPRTLVGLEGIVFSPLLHASWAHLMANTLPLLIFGWLAMSGGFRQFVAVTVVVWLVSGVGTWLTGSPGLVLGASGIAFGWMVFLLVRGWFLRSVKQVLVALVLFVLWGGMLWGILPGQPGIAWQDHLFGAVGGVAAAWMVARNYRSGGGPRGSATLPT
jgi:membrane associated rhomboid family serine protease